MRNSDMTRRALLASLPGASLCVAQSSEPWVELFDGRTLDGWRASENTGSWTVRDGALLAAGPRSHLFYAGPVRGASFRNFDLQVEVMTKPAANSGVYFHTAFQEKGFPRKGFEIQVNNTATGEGNYRERKKTGSLYGVRNVYKQLAQDNEWITLDISVRGKYITVRVNGTLVVEFTEPSPPVIAEGNERDRFVDQGTFALQCHDPGSQAQYRRIRVRPLPDGLTTPTQAPQVDDVYRDILAMGARNIPMVDYHLHLKGTLTLDQVLSKCRRDGIQCGLAVNCGKGFPVQDDASARRFLETLKGQPVFIAMQAEGREWTQMFSRAAVGLFDYVFTDSMTWTDNRGKRMRLWIPNEVGTIADTREFMETLVERTTGILDREPVDIYVNPTFLPDVIAKDYAALWTEERMKKVIDAAVRNGIAIEINNRYRLPSATFLKMAKASGAKFSFGTNNTGADDVGRCEYGLEMVKECKLGWQDFFVPLPAGQKAIDRKPKALKS